MLTDSERGKDPADVGERDRRVRARREPLLLGSRGSGLGCLGIAAQAGDGGGDGFRAGLPHRLTELGGQAAPLVGGRNGCVQSAGRARDRAVQHEATREVPESSLGTQAVDGCAEKRQGEVERADDEGRRTEVPRRLGVAVAGRGDFTEAGEHFGSVAQRVGIGEFCRLR
jgi:hypothetical protein